MSRTTKKQLTLLQVWSRTYLLSLLLGIIVVGLLAVQWMKFSTEQNRLHTIQHITERMAEKVVSDKGEFVSSNEFYKLLRDSQKDLDFKNPIRGHVKSADQRIVYPAPPNDGDPPQGGPAGGGPRNAPPGGNGARDPIKEPPGGGNPDSRRERPEPPAEMFDGLLPQVSSYVKKKDEEGLSIFMFSAPITYNDTIIGGMYMSIQSDEVTQVKVDYGMLYLLLAGGALLGWGMIYLLTRRLIKPIKEVADAAKQLMVGNYDVSFQSNSKEQEIAQLITAFQEMSNRLKQLESLRTLLIAGVTHELKTPVASISGLLQAVLDKVVEGPESEEFIQLSLKEAQRMHSMVEDLLDFNSFATGALRTTQETVELNAFIKEVVYQWRIAQDEHQNWIFKSRVCEKPSRSKEIQENSANSHQSIEQQLTCGASRGVLRISLYDYSDTQIGIDVADQGKGIPQEEQPYILKDFTEVV